LQSVWGRVMRVGSFMECWNFKWIIKYV
jgi:hypothetical protein